MHIATLYLYKKIIRIKGKRKYKIVGITKWNELVKEYIKRGDKE